MPNIAIAIVGLWGAAAAAIAGSGVLESLPRFVAPLGLAGSVIAFFLLSSRGLREQLDLRLLLAVHLPRAAIGAAFLAGDLPRVFAVPAGIGDILAGLGAAGALVVGRSGFTRAWNLLGLADMVMVIVSAQRLILFGGPDAAAPFLRFPFPMLPLFLVPLILISHGIILVRLRRGMIPA